MVLRRWLGGDATPKAVRPKESRPGCLWLSFCWARWLVCRWAAALRREDRSASWCSVLFCASSRRLRVWCRGHTSAGPGRRLVSPGPRLALQRYSKVLNPCYKGGLKSTGVIREVSAGNLKCGHLTLEVTQVSSRVGRERPDLFL